MSNTPGPRRGFALIAEDDPLLQWAVSQIVEALGYHVETASTRAEMLARITGGPIDLLVTSSALERHDVMDIVRDLRRCRRETAVCVLCSRENTEEYRESLPGSALVEKPFALEDLAQSVRRAAEEADRAGF